MATELLREEEGLGPNGLPPSGWSPCDSVAALSCFCPLREERVRRKLSIRETYAKRNGVSGSPCHGPDQRSINWSINPIYTPVVFCFSENRIGQLSMMLQWLVTNSNERKK